VVFVVCSVSSGHFDELIASSEESYRMYVSVCVYDIGTPRLELGCCVT